MIIGIEAERANHPQKTGVEHYAKQLILHLAEIDKGNQYVLYLRTKPQEWFLNLPQNFHIKVLPFPIFWTQVRLSWEMLMHSVDVLLIPASALPLIHPKKSVVTIHDLAWRFFPETFTWFNRQFLNWSTAFAVRSAFKVIAVSEATKQDLIKSYSISAEKIAVVHHGFEKPSSKGYLPDEFLAGKIRPDKYVLFLSTLQPRKNLQRLIEAFKLLKAEHPELSHKLVVAGKPGWKFDDILKSIKDNKDFVVYLNYVGDAERLSLLQNAELMVLPSLYEGFGMQILESFAAGTPVATSNISSMPEVAQAGAIYFDPKNISEIKNSIRAVLLDQSLREKLAQAGSRRLQDFSWEKCARQTLQVLTS